jgi:hypothetical protein
LIFIVFLVRKIHNQDKSLADGRGLEGLCLASASLFQFSALNIATVANCSHVEAKNSPQNCFSKSKNTKTRPDRESRAPAIVTEKRGWG